MTKRFTNGDSETRKSIATKSVVDFLNTSGTDFDQVCLVNQTNQQTEFKKCIFEENS